MISVAQTPITMRWQSTWPAKDIFHEYALDFAKKVNDIKAPMPGMVLKILVKEGDTVKKGEPIIAVSNKVQRLSQENAALAALTTDQARSLTTDQGVRNATAATATLTRSTSGAPVTLNKSFSPVSVSGGALSQLTISLGNNNAGALALTQAALTDTFPAGMIVADSPAASFTGAGCTLGTVVATPGAPQVLLTGLSVRHDSTRRASPVDKSVVRRSSCCVYLALRTSRIRSNFIFDQFGTMSHV